MEYVRFLIYTCYHGKCIRHAVTLARLLKKTHLEAFEKDIRELSEAWFTDSMVSANMIPDSITDMADFVLESSTYGSVQVEMKKQIERTGRFRTFMSQMFRPYRMMKVMYPVLKNLLFCCWYYGYGD